MTAGLGVMSQSEELAELLIRKTGITNNAAKRESIDRVVTRNSQDSSAIGHDDVFALTHDHEARFFEGAHSVEMVDAGNLWQG